MNLTAPTLSIYWDQMSAKECLAHFNNVGNRLIEHRYRYYVLDQPVLDDFEYDFVERYYKFLADHLGLPDTAIDMVGFDLKREDCQQAKHRVDTDTDSYSLWYNDMQPIWDKLGKTKDQIKSEIK